VMNIDTSDGTPSGPAARAAVCAAARVEARAVL
jgi:hypothetical protein